MTFDFLQAYNLPYGLMGMGDNQSLMYHHQQISPHPYEMGMGPQNLSTPPNSNGSSTSLVPAGEKTETKPRLHKDEVARLEQIFSENHKPNSNLKRTLAEQMHVDVARINNWFQNRRAKAKQEKKQDEFEQRQKQAESLNPEDPSYHGEQDQLPDSYDPETPSPFPSVRGPPAPVPTPRQPRYDDRTAASTISFQQAMDALTPPSSSFPSVCGPPAPISILCQPRYDDRAVASVDSFQQTMNLRTRPAGEQDAFATEQSDSSPPPGMAFPENGMSDGIGGADRAQFPSSDELDLAGNVWVDELGLRDSFTLPGAPAQFRAEVEPPSHEPLSFEDFPNGSDLNNCSPLGSGNLLPSQLLHVHPTNSEAQNDFAHVFEQPEPTRSESNDKPYQPQPNGLRFGPTPGSANIAIRRRGFQPPTLGTTPRNNSYIGPKTTKSPSINRAGAMSPGHQPHMRRIMSAAALNSYVNTNGSRIQKSYPTSAQRSPISFKGFADADQLMESNAHTMMRPYLAGAVANGVRPPPTPMSPPNMAAHLEPEMMPSSPSPDDAHRPFEGDFPGSYLASPCIAESALVSPPVTPRFFHHDMSQAHWSSSYSLPDEPLSTPGTATFAFPDPYAWPSAHADGPALSPYHGVSGFALTAPGVMPFDLAAPASNSDESVYADFPVGVVAKSSPQSSCGKKELHFENHTAKDYEGASK